MRIRGPLAAALLATVVLSPAAVSAQTTDAFTARRWTLGGVIGAGAVEEVGVLAGGTIGFRATNLLDIVGEGIWSANTATRRRLDLASNLAARVGTVQGSAAAGTLSVPTVYAGGGIRLPLAGPRPWRPYVAVTAGVARMTLRPEITLAGGDITSRLPQFGVTLGSDLTGVVTKPAAGVSLGVRRLVGGRGFFDAGFRLIYVQTPEQPTSLLGASATLGFAL